MSDIELSKGEYADLVTGLLNHVKTLRKELDELKEKLELIRKVAIHNSQGNSIIPTSLIFDEVSE